MPQVVHRKRTTGALLFSGEGQLVLFCFQEKGTGALLFSGEENRCYTVLRRWEQVHYCS